MTDNMIRVKQEIFTAIIQFDEDKPQLAPMLNVGAMSVMEFIDEMIMELIRYSFDLYQDKNSLRGHLQENKMFEDNQKAAYSRALKYAQEYRDLEADKRLADGTQLTDEQLAILRGLEMKTMAQKKSGHKITPMQFFELTQLQRVRILKSFVEHRLENTHKVKHGDFKDMFSEYDDFLKSLIPTEKMTSEEIVFNTLAFWVLEWKYPLQFFYDVALFMEERVIDDIPAISLCCLCGDCTMPYKYGTVGTHSRFIKKRTSMIPKILCEEGHETDDIDFNKFTLGQYLTIKSLMMQNYMFDVDKGIMLKDWFYNNTSVDDWASFLKEYDLFSVLKEKEWTDYRINTVRKLISKMTITYDKRKK